MERKKKKAKIILCTYTPPPSWGFINIIKYNSTLRIHYMMIWVADFIFLIMLCLGKCQKWVSISRADTGGTVEAGLAGRSSETFSTGAGWKTHDLIIQSVQSQSTNAHWGLTIYKSYGREEYGQIYAKAWQGGGMWLRMALTEHSLCSRPVWSILHASSFCALRVTLVYDSRNQGSDQVLEAYQSHRACEQQN